MSRSTGEPPVERDRRPLGRRSPAVTVLLGLVLGALAALTPAAPASAHAVLVSTTPAARSVVGAPPTEAQLRFSEPIRPVAGRIQVLAPDGQRIDAGEPTVADGVLRIPLRTADRPLGTYLVSYRVISADSHPVGGAFAFSAGAPSAAPAASGQAGRTDPATRIAVGVAKYLGYVGLALLIGPALVLARLWPAGLSRRGPNRLVQAGFSLVGAGTLSALWLQAPYGAGTGPLDVSWRELSATAASGFGAALLIRLALLAAVAVLLPPVLAGRGDRTRGWLLGLLAVAGLATWPLSGHAVASAVPAMTVAADLVHLAAASVWLGGLLTVVAFLVRRAGEEELGPALRGWSRWAAVSVGWLVFGGVVQALVNLGSLDALLHTGYGRLMLGKVGLLALTLGVAGYSRRLVLRRAAPAPRSRLRRAVWVEAGVIALVLGLSAALVQANPRGAPAPTVVAADEKGTAQTLTSALYTLQFDVYPVQRGDNNTLHLYAYKPDGSPLTVAEWRVTAAQPARSVEPVDVPVLPIGDNHAIGELTFATGGDWRVRFTVRVSDFDQATVTATIPVP